MTKLTDDQSDEIKSAREGGGKTLRPVSKGLEAILFEPISVLDHGFVRVVDCDCLYGVTPAGREFLL